LCNSQNESWEVVEGQWGTCIRLSRGWTGWVEGFYSGNEDGGSSVSGKVGEGSFRCTGDELALDLYRTNSLSSGDAFLHLYELPVTEYMLYELRCHW